MKPDEIRLVLIIVAAVIVAALIQDWRGKHPEFYPVQNRPMPTPSEPQAAAQKLNLGE